MVGLCIFTVIVKSNGKNTHHLNCVKTLSPLGVVLGVGWGGVGGYVGMDTIMIDTEHPSQVSLAYQA